MKKIIEVLRNGGLALLSGAILLVPRIVGAAPAYPVPVPTTQKITLTTLTGWITNIADALVYIGITIAVIFIVWGGITYMVAGGDTEAATKAKTRLWNGIIGALVVLGVGLIINTIEYLIGFGVTYN